MRETVEYFNLLNRVSAAVQQIPQRAATVAVNFSKERFRAQNWVDNRTEPWAKRASRDKRKGRAILVDTGRLRRSIRKVLVTQNMVIIGTDVSYAAAHNFGFKGLVTIKQHKRNRYSKTKQSYNTRTGKTRSRNVKTVNGSGIVRSHKRHMNIRRRQFIGSSAVLENQLTRMMSAEIIKAFKNK